MVGIYIDNVLCKKVGVHGLHPEELSDFSRFKAIGKVQGELFEIWEERQQPGRGLAKALGVINTPYDEELRHNISQLVAKIKARLGEDYWLVLCGIGGSESPATAVIHGCGNQSRYLPITTLNPDFFTALEQKLSDQKKVVILIVSRSGDTLETQVAAALAQKDAPALAQVIVVTKKESKLDKEGVETVYVHEAHSGRFTGLAAANIAAMALMGVDVDAFHQGGRQMLERCLLAESIFDNPAMLQAAIIFGMTLKPDVVDPERVVERGQKVVLNTGVFSPQLVPYSWMSEQLFEESLGHRKDIALVTKTTELPKALHSAFQNWVQGANITLHRFIKPVKYETDDTITVMVGDKKQTVALSTLESATYLATVRALTKEQRPNYTLFIDSLTPEAMGELMMCEMLTVIYLGERLGLGNGEKEYFIQPGVELYKQLVKEYLTFPQRVKEEMDAILKFIVMPLRNGSGGG